jgi:hypothetical protein
VARQKGLCAALLLIPQNSKAEDARILLRHILYIYIYECICIYIYIQEEGFIVPGLCLSQINIGMTAL